ncbi:hypothetical protein QMT40_002979 [Parvibaculaceae bacterium PLY_AMNH_Bact1]|nr:hypothetical protein QMT40_002979 [Parvibaculaceae bacterium PLY_AMNH_Bact1]
MSEIDYKAKLITENHALTAGFSGGTWAAELPLENMIDRRVVARPARCETPDNLATSQFEVTLQRRRNTKFFGLFRTNLSLLSKIKITFGGDAAFTTVLHQVDWTRVYDRFHKSLSLEWEDPNFWTGGALEGDLDRYGRNRFFLFDAAISAQHIRVEIDDPTNPDGYVDIGYLYVGSNISTRFNYQRGRRLRAVSRTRRDETPSGHPVFDRRRPKRVQEVSYPYLYEEEVTAFLDAGMSNDIVDPVVFVPDPQDEIANQRGAFLGTFVDLPGALHRFDGNHQSNLQIEEIIA